MTASHFGEICKQRVSFGPLTIRLLYVQCKETAQMRYRQVNEPHVREQYALYLKSNHHQDASITTTGIHADLKVNNNNLKYHYCTYRQEGWLGASPDGLVYDPSAEDPHGLLKNKMSCIG